MELAPAVIVALALFGLAGGIGITAVGPGGVLPTIGMFLLTGLSPSGVAGTAIATHIATGALGTAAYSRSGQLRDPATRHMAAVLAVSAVVGTPIGVLCNTAVSGSGFAILLAIVVAVTGALVLLREHGRFRNDRVLTMSTTSVVAVGLPVAVVAGLFGLGGPMLCVPVLVICGVPVLSALAAAQAQSVIIACIGTVGYLLNGAIDWQLAALVGIPELAGVIIGWKIAQAVPTRVLKYALAGTLLVLAPYLAFHV